MGRIIIFMSMASLLLLLVGSHLMPNNPAMWLAGTTPVYLLLRGLLIVPLGILLITKPPRHISLRVLLSLVAAGVLLAVLWFTYTNKLSALDTLSFAAAGISMAIAALEFDEEVTKLATKAQASRKHRGHTPALSAK